VDAQLPPALARFLESQGYETQAVREVGLREADDETIWTFAEKGPWVVVTKDEDFVERVLRRGVGPQVVWLRIGNCTNRVLFTWLEPLLPAMLREISAGQRVVELRRSSRRLES